MIAAVCAGPIYFAVVFAAGFALGVARVLVLAPRLGETAAIAFEIPLILLVSWIVAARLADRFDVDERIGPRLVMGGVAFGLLMLAEFAVSLLAFGRSVGEHIEAYETLPSMLGLLGQIAFGLIPAVQALWRVRPVPSGPPG